MKLYCRSCGARIRLEVEPRCRRCGQELDRARPETYHTSGPWTRMDSWVPGFLFGIGLGIAGFAFAASHADRGWPVFLALPLAVGLVMGLTIPMSQAMTVVLALFGSLLLATGLLGGGMAGLFCAGTIAVVSVVPMLVGILIGGSLRYGRLRRRARRNLTILLVAGFPLVAAEIGDRLGPTGEIVVVRTARTVDAEPAVVWRHLHLYEEIEADPPWLLRFGLPVPVRAAGSKGRVGDIEECVYENGKGLKKRFTEVRGARRLAFEVTDQRLGFEHDLTLLDGAFDLEPLDGGRTRLTLSTRYRARSYPGWLWRGLEEHVLHVLHDHVAGEVERLARAEARTRTAAR